MKWSRESWAVRWRKARWLRFGLAVALGFLLLFKMAFFPNPRPLRPVVGGEGALAEQAVEGAMRLRPMLVARLDNSRAWVYTFVGRVDRSSVDHEWLETRSMWSDQRVVDDIFEEIRRVSRADAEQAAAYPFLERRYWTGGPSQHAALWSMGRLLVDLDEEVFVLVTFADYADAESARSAGGAVAAEDGPAADAGS